METSTGSLPRPGGVVTVARSASLAPGMSTDSSESISPLLTSRSTIRRWSAWLLKRSPAPVATDSWISP